jgi:hypothetical protein
VNWQELVELAKAAGWQSDNEDDEDTEEEDEEENG